jgi:DNA-binding MarR family transcriptional regulator
MSDTDHFTPYLPLPALLDDVAQLGFGELRRRLRAEGHPMFRSGHGCVFRYIDEDGTRLTALAERSGFTKQAVGEAVDDLERMGYVERAPDPLDGRAKIIRLTALGAEGRGEAKRIFDAMESELAERFGERQIADLRALLEQIVSDSEPTAADARRNFAAV